MADDREKQSARDRDNVYLSERVEKAEAERDEWRKVARASLEREGLDRIARLHHQCDQLYAAIIAHRAAVTAAGDVHVDSLDIPKAQAKRTADVRLWRLIDESAPSGAADMYALLVQPRLEGR